MTDLNIAYGIQEETIMDNNYNLENNIDIETEKNNNINIEKKIKKKKMDIDDRPILNRQNDANIPINLNDTISDSVYKKYQPNQHNQMNQHNQHNQNNQHSQHYQMNQNTNNKNDIQQINNENTFWNRFINKKYEVFKLFLFSLVIVLAIGTDKVFVHYLNKYINENILTNLQELIVRIAYPILIILVLWIFKAI